MMIVMKVEATPEEIRAVVERVESVGAKAHLSEGEEVTVIGPVGDREHVQRLGLAGHAGVDQVIPILKPYKLPSRQFAQGERPLLDLGGRRLGGEHLWVLAGPGTPRRRRAPPTPARASA